jgi:hypothetical protein
MRRENGKAKGITASSSLAKESHHTGGTPMRYLATRAAAVVLLAAVALRADDTADPRAVPVGEKVAGKTHAEWSAAWWQWAMAIKKDRNPILDPTGEFAAANQPEGVFFLAGNTGGKTTRKVAVPAGVPVFFPVVNYVHDEAPGKADEKTLRAGAKADIDRMTLAEATLDGKPVAGLDKMRVASAVFTFAAPEKPADSLFEESTGKRTAVSDGYWVMLKPLAPGKHALNFKAKLKAGGGSEALELDVTYELTVAEKK